MLLFLDDSPERAAVMYQRMAPQVRERTIWCTTAEETIVVLRDYRKDLELVMLDHDLGGKQFVNSKREDCGMEVVRYLEHFNHHNPIEFEDFKTVGFIVHTHNIPAGQIMVERLKKLGINKVSFKPFGE